MHAYIAFEHLNSCEQNPQKQPMRLCVLGCAYYPGQAIELGVGGFCVSRTCVNPTIPSPIIHQHHDDDHDHHHYHQHHHHHHHHHQPSPVIIKQNLDDIHYRISPPASVFPVKSRLFPKQTPGTQGSIHLFSSSRKCFVVKNIIYNMCIYVYM